MAIAYASSLVTFSAHSPHKFSFASPNNSCTPFLGFSFAAIAAKPIIRTPSLANHTRQIRCQDLSVVAKDQRWMFEESEIDGPVCSLSLLNI